MTYNFPPKVRFALYVLTSLGTIAAGYLFNKQHIGEEELIAWGSVVTLVSTMAAFNTSENKYSSK